MSHRIPQRATHADPSPARDVSLQPTEAGSSPLPDAVVAVLPRLPDLQDVPAAAIRATPLGSWSNDVWRLDTPAGSFALRLPGESGTNAIPRADEVHHLASAASIGVAVPARVHDPSDGLLLTPWIATKAAFDAAAPDAAARMGALLARLHRSKLAFRWRFDGEAVAAAQIRHLPADDPARDLLAARQPDALALLRRLEATRGALAPCHNDPNPANVLDDGSTLRLIDWGVLGDERSVLRSGSVRRGGCARRQRLSRVAGGVG